MTTHHHAPSHRYTAQSPTNQPYIHLGPVFSCRWMPARSCLDPQFSARVGASVGITHPTYTRCVDRGHCAAQGMVGGKSQCADDWGVASQLKGVSFAQAEGVVLGGVGAFRTNGRMHFGVRALVSELVGDPDASHTLLARPRLSVPVYAWYVFLFGRGLTAITGVLDYWGGVCSQLQVCILMYLLQAKFGCNGCAGNDATGGCCC